MSLIEMQIYGSILVYGTNLQRMIQETVSTYILKFEHHWARLTTPNIFVDFHYHYYHHNSDKAIY